MRSVRTVVVAVALAVATVAASAVVAACGGEAAVPAAAQKSPGAADATAIAVAGQVVIDVRTSGEFAEGHLDGAINLDVESGAFEQALSELDPTQSYIVYCRSGRRSSIAAAWMAEQGFADVTDLGSLEQAALATGLAVVGN
jgi:phage shock protein E